MAKTRIHRSVSRAIHRGLNPSSGSRSRWSLGDLEELSDLLDEDCVWAGHLLTRRAVTAGDLRELQRLWDAGSDEAGHELERLLAAPIDVREG
ncbi:hypothetical protein [Streptosporangium subroseum]|uniref:hypothetical protein n=1 Tax=Streptosporangium subroseum TaxID=106412 RepID=UPI0030886349|nr:hypothetical protein OHB15_11410 [Streptosporangium subroseum]